MCVMWNPLCPISLEPSPSMKCEPLTFTRPSRVTVSREPTATSLRMCGSCAQSPVLNHIRTESRSCLLRSSRASPAQVTANP